SVRLASLLKPSRRLICSTISRWRATISRASTRGSFECKVFFSSSRQVLVGCLVGPHERRTAMEHYAGIDVSLERSSVCVVDALGKIVQEAKSSEPAALVAFFEALGFAVKPIGLEAGPLSQWLHTGLTRAGFEAVLLETRHVKAALSAMR